MDYFSKKDKLVVLIEKFLQSKILLYCAVALLVFKIAVFSVAINFPQNIFFADITKTSLVDMANQSREASGLKPLAESTALDKAAEMKAEDMVQNQYFAHTSPEGITPWHWFSEIGYAYKYAGENLAIGFIDSKEVYQAWLNSPSHRENLLNPNYKEVGTAILSGYGENNAIVVVQFFGSLQNQSVVSLSNPNSNLNNIKPAEKITAEKPKSSQQPAEKVLSQSTESIAPPLYNYESVLQNIVYAFLIITICFLLSLLFFNFSGAPQKELVLRSILVLVLLSLTALISREILVSIIPHHITI